MITALDIEDGWKKSAEGVKFCICQNWSIILITLISGFTPASRTSEADASGDVKSVKRAMDQPLRLMAKNKLGTDEFWDLPTMKHQEGETLRDTAERAVIRNLGQHPDVTILGNSPWSFYKVKYPRHYQESTQRKGAKIWIFKGILMNHFHDEAKIDLNKNLLDYWWATREELKENLDRRTYKALDNMLHDED